jgi:transcriptional regulator with XRE-family HTH domain
MTMRYALLLHENVLAVLVLPHRTRGFPHKYAERAEVHRTYVGLIERGERTPTLSNLVKLAKGLGMKASELLSDASL